MLYGALTDTETIGRFRLRTTRRAMVWKVMPLSAVRCKVLPAGAFSTASR